MPSAFMAATISEAPPGPRCTWLSTMSIALILDLEYLNRSVT
jgi:hypothetical protein